MPIQTRLSLLLPLLRAQECLIKRMIMIVNFRYYSRPVPSLNKDMEEIKRCIWGLFSRLLLPSLRISFMVLPIELMDAYSKCGRIMKIRQLQN